MDVRDYGARGDDVANDTAAIQKANDAVASRGGGTVFFPRGTYIAVGVVQDSGVAFVGAGGATLMHPDGISSQPIVTSRTFATSGSIEAGSRVLTVVDPHGIEPGAVIAVRGAGGPSPVQFSPLQIASLLSEDRLNLASPSGFGGGQNHALVGSEVISYERVDFDWLVGVRRGLFGTAPTPHNAGEVVSQLRVHLATVDAVVGTSITLSRPAAMTVTGAPVETGSQDMTLEGLSFDGRRRISAPPPHGAALTYALGRHVTITDCTIRNGGHAAIIFDRGTRDSVVRHSVLEDNGAPAQRLGAAMWLFRGASKNAIEDNKIQGDSFLGIAIDDRSEGSSEWDADSRANRVSGNEIHIPSVNSNTAVMVSNSTGSEVISNDIDGASYGVRVLTSGQGTRPMIAEGNLVRGNSLRRHDVGLHVTGSRNDFAENVFTDVARKVIDEGEGNRFDGGGSS